MSSIYQPFNESNVFNTDSYAISMPHLLNPDIRMMRCAGGNRSTEMFPATMVFGVQGYLKSEFMRPVHMADVEEAAEFYQGHGEPFDFEGWKRIALVHGGLPPVSLRWVPEGTLLPGSNTMYTMVNTDDEVSPLVMAHLETGLVRAAWYMSSVATVAFFAKRLILKHLRETSDADEETLMNVILPYMLNDFGARGSTSPESAARGGAAHLLMFKGTDNVLALRWLKRYYGEPMAGNSIIATNHMIMSSEGRDGEARVVRRVFEKVRELKASIYAMVADTFDMDNHALNILPEIRDELRESGIRLVSRPDSGTPTEVLPRHIKNLGATFSVARNSKGFQVLEPCIRSIQGDGIKNLTSMDDIMNAVREAGLAVENTCFGMGAGLLQDRMRDDQGFAQKATSAWTADGGWYDVFKDPVTSGGTKKSRPGNLAAFKFHDGRVETIDIDRNRAPSERDAVRLDREVYRDGRLLIDEPLSVMRERADSYL